MRTYILKATLRVENKLFEIRQEITTNCKGKDILDAFDFDYVDEITYGPDIECDDDEVTFKLAEDDYLVIDYEDLWEYMIALEIELDE